MERLTMRIKNIAKCGYESTEECEAMESCYQCERYKAMASKLAAYEDAGLTPEEISTLKAERDAAIKDLGFHPCLVCKYNKPNCVHPCERNKGDKTCFEWRGIGGQP